MRSVPHRPGQKSRETDQSSIKRTGHPFCTGESSEMALPASGQYKSRPGSIRTTRFAPRTPSTVKRINIALNRTSRVSRLKTRRPRSLSDVGCRTRSSSPASEEVAGLAWKKDEVETSAAVKSMLTARIKSPASMNKFTHRRPANRRLSSDPRSGRDRR